MIYIGVCPECNAINAACFQYDAKLIEDMLTNGLIVKKVEVERISVKWCEHCENGNEPNAKPAPARSGAREERDDE